MLSRVTQLENAHIAGKFDRTGITLKQLWTNLKNEGLGKQSNITTDAAGHDGLLPIFF
jgi:hypothetical protein